MTLKLFARIVWETFQWVALLGGALGVLTGLALIFNSALVVRLSERVNVWISSRQAMRGLEKPIDVERAVYRWHRLVGALLLIAALFTVYILVVRFKGPEVVDALARLLHLRVARWAAEGLRIFLLVVDAVAIIISILMIVRPSALKPLEAWANREYSGRQATRPLDIQRTGPDSLLTTHPRALGWTLLLAGLYVLISLGYRRFVG